jgi:biopolymer transport protein ExbD
MVRTLGVSLASLLAVVSSSAFAQQAVPLQRGVSVQMAVSRNAVAVPDADTASALVVALTADGTIYLNAEPVPAADLAGRVTSIVSARTDKTLYIKADARVPYSRLVEIIDAVQTAGIGGVTLLTAQQDASDQGRRPVPPKGLEMRVVSRGR